MVNSTSESGLVDIVNGKIDVLKLHDAVKSPQSGAIVLFSGITRDNFEGKRVELLSYDCYRPRALKTLNEIASMALKTPGVFKVALVHRIGEVPVSEESVVIVVSAAHRKEGWKTAEWILEEVKMAAEIWKCEVYRDSSSSWVEGTVRSQ